MKTSSTAPGKIILTGEYAVVFGYPGIAIPSPMKMDVEFREDRNYAGIKVKWEGIKGDEQWNSYLKRILNQTQKFKGAILQGHLTINNSIPLCKGLGSSTALIIAVCRGLLCEDCRSEALLIENKLSPNNSGIDFNVIWEGIPILYKKDEGFKPVDLPNDIFKNTVLIDTGSPNETTAELVAWIGQRREKEPEVNSALEIIGKCTDELLQGDGMPSIIRKNYRAQFTLGIVPGKVQKLIADIENSGGAAKVLGAGGRTGDGGMVLAIHKNPDIFQVILDKHQLKSIPLNYG